MQKARGRSWAEETRDKRSLLTINNEDGGSSSLLVNKRLEQSSGIRVCNVTVSCLPWSRSSGVVVERGRVFVSSYQDVRTG